MMRKIFITLATAFTFYFHAQTILPDHTFGTDGLYSFVDATTGYSVIESIIQPDGKIVVAGQRMNGSNNSEVYVARLNANGTLDTTFAVNGFFTGYQNPDAFNSNLFIKGDRILIFYPEQGALIKLNFSGMPDTSFGTNGILILGQVFGKNTVLIDDNLFSTRSGSLDKINISTGVHSSVSVPNISEIKSVYGGTNGNLLLRSINETTYTTYLTSINTNGIVNTSFGTNGTMTVNVSQTSTDFNNSYDYVVTDGSNNIYYGCSNESDLTSIIKKFYTNGNVVLSFGNNGSYQFVNNILSDLKILSNQIYLGGININGSNLNLFLSRLNQDGTLDNTFNNNGIFVFDTNLLNEWAESLNVVSPTTVIVSGEYIGINNTTFVGKFLVTPDLSTSEKSSDNNVWFENPLKSHLVFKSNEKIEKIELYSIDGKHIKTVYNNNAQISDLMAGAYIAKVKLQNGNVLIKKLVKK